LQSSVGDVSQELRSLERTQSLYNERSAGLNQSHAKVADQLSILIGEQAQLVEQIQSARQEHEQLTEAFQALQQGHHELVEYSRSLRQSHEDLVQTLQRSNNRLQEAELELLELKQGLESIKNSLLFRGMHWLAAALRSLTFSNWRRKADGAVVSSIVVPTGQTSERKRNDRTSNKSS